MGKVISLKLTTEEEKIVNELRQKGVTPSSLIRDSLWQYFDKPNQKEKTDTPNAKVDDVYLDKYLLELEKEAEFWKVKYEALESFWNEKYEILEEAYRSHVQESITEIDTKFDIILERLFQVPPSTHSQTSDTTEPEYESVEEETPEQPIVRSSLSDRIDLILKQRCTDDE